MTLSKRANLKRPHQKKNQKFATVYQMLTIIILHYIQSIIHMKLISYMVIITHFQKRIKFCSEKQKN